MTESDYFQILSMVKYFSIPRGTSDILPPEIPVWQDIETKIRSILNNYNYKEIRTPIFEETELFARSMGQTSDVVLKQMLNLASQKKSDDDHSVLSGLSLRPENTASVVRSYIENRFDKKEGITKLYYIGPMFRGERPQKGRLRQFHQVGVEAIGPDSLNPYLDAEIITLSVCMLKKLGIKELKLIINTLGTNEDKAAFSKRLRLELKDKISKLGKADQDRYERNVFRILDSKDKETQNIVNKLDIDYSHLSEESNRYFDEVKKALDSLGVEYIQDPKLVRGLDYYTQTVFEIVSPSLGSQDALGAGGRYNNLVSELGGPKVDAVGFALGLERIIIANDSSDVLIKPLDVFILALDERSREEAFKRLNELRENELDCDMNYKIASVKSLMRLADKSGARFAMIIGEEELNNQQATVKDMNSGEQEKISLTDLNQMINRIK